MPPNAKQAAAQTIKDLCLRKVDEAVSAIDAIVEGLRFDTKWSLEHVNDQLGLALLNRKTSRKPNAYNVFLSKLAAEAKLDNSTLHKCANHQARAVAREDGPEAALVHLNGLAQASYAELTGGEKEALRAEGALKRLEVVEQNAQRKSSTVRSRASRATKLNDKTALKLGAANREYGLQSIAITSSSYAGDSWATGILGTELGNQFLEEKYNISMVKFATLFNNFCTYREGIPVNNLNAATRSNQRTLITTHLGEALNKATSKKTSGMIYNTTKLAQHYDLELVGWPEGVPVRPPNKLLSPELLKVWKACSSGEISFEPVEVVVGKGKGKKRKRSSRSSDSSSSPSDGEDE
ncbi:hypothetical protein P7C70_g6349, partial [Phenoliferia sp. Uapishka_3]